MWYLAVTGYLDATGYFCVFFFVYLEEILES